MSIVLEVDNLTKKYPNGRGVRNVSLTVSAGDVFGFIGPNGSGKTTVLKLVTGLLRQDQGDVRLFGRSVAERPSEALAQVGCLIETADAYAYMSGYDNLKLSARLYPGLPKSAIDRALELVGLEPYKRERVAGYSLGMKQRLGLASALLANPRLVILDEPANGLDIEAMVDFRSTVARLAYEQHTAFLISSHLIHDLSLIVNRFGMMYDGRLIHSGDAKSLHGQGKTLEEHVMMQLDKAKGEACYG